MVRLFTAFDLSGEIREGIGRIAPVLRQSRARLTPVDSEGAHITLAFIGEVPENRVGPIQDALTIVRSAPFSVTVAGVSGNNPRHPRVVWASVKDNGESAAVYGQVADALVPLGIPKEDRPYTPHVTIARVKEFDPSLLPQIAQVSQTVFGTCQITGFTLKKSTLGPGGAHYEDILGVSF
jgi:RNA 2',3'-cyclic 3'-phosphodiesterase